MDSRDYINLKAPGHDVCELIKKLARQAAFQLDTDEVGGEADGAWIDRTADSLYDDIYEAIVHCEVDTPANAEQDARLEHAVGMHMRRGLV